MAEKKPAQTIQIFIDPGLREPNVIDWLETYQPQLRPNAGKFAFRFYPHFHPYVGKLVERLGGPTRPGESGIGKLQAIDTADTDKIMVRHEDKRLAVIPKSIPVK